MDCLRVCNFMDFVSPTGKTCNHPEITDSCPQPGARQSAPQSTSSDL